MPYIIHPSQTGFIKDRSISENFILAMELLGDFNQKASNKFFCAKFDIHKAFDSVSREFILNRMIAKGFPPIFISWIKNCITDIYFSIAINVALEGYFSSSSGLRQGCPLSLYLFSIAMDGLSSSFEDAISAGTFLDDLLVFGKSTTDNAQSLMNLLSSFADLSGLKVNPEKSLAFFSKYATDVNEICGILNIPQAHSPITYLGLPIFTRKLCKADFQPLMNKLYGLLDGWKAKLLSFAGRIQYMKFTICNTLAYWIRGAIIPKSCCKAINKLCSRFLFFGDITKRKLHLVSWRDTCSPKDYGGLGILFDWWRNKYLSLWKPLPQRTSVHWKFICGVANSVKTMLKLSVTDNSKLSFFWDPWCSGRSIYDLSLEYNDLPLNSPTSSFETNKFLLNGHWNIPRDLNPAIISAITSIPITDKSVCCWNQLDKPTFKVFLRNFYVGYSETSWHHYIWHKIYALRFSAHSWLAFCNGLKTADALLRRGYAVLKDYDECNLLFFPLDGHFGNQGNQSSV
ncbi:uncharacterized protein LOC110104847 [Dendrobium catenatum]|uniref:uncharacterized protein LOC110104847 n=1 Tax=Dendrobium catenatum TaxID=906689 RepID=UPI0009F264F9|nr:uncharacterized protein LOC110104847 [Dendrobium catenatum]